MKLPETPSIFKPGDRLLRIDPAVLSLLPKAPPRTVPGTSMVINDGLRVVFVGEHCYVIVPRDLARRVSPCKECGALGVVELPGEGEPAPGFDGSEEGPRTRIRKCDACNGEGIK